MKLLVGRNHLEVRTFHYSTRAKSLEGAIFCLELGASNLLHQLPHVYSESTGARGDMYSLGPMLLVCVQVLLIFYVLVPEYHHFLPNLRFGTLQAVLTPSINKTENTSSERISRQCDHITGTVYREWYKYLYTMLVCVQVN